jgi:hypothetical protein
MGLTAIKSHVGEANSEINSQAELLAQIISALDGKAAGGSGGGSGMYRNSAIIVPIYKCTEVI